MPFIFDRYAYLNSPIHRWEQRSKLVALLALIFAFAFIKNLFLLPATIFVTTSLYFLSRLPFNFLLSRLRYPGLFIIVVVFFLPFIAGNNVIFRIGFLEIKQEGSLLVLLILVRFFCIFTISLILFSTAPFLTTIKAMRSLGLSDTIVDMMLLFYRYLEELSQMLEKMQTAMKLRGFRFKNFNIRNLNIIASLIGTLLVRSYDRSLLIYKAMILRGYGSQKLNFNSHNKIDKMSLFASVITLIIAASFILAEFLIV